MLNDNKNFYDLAAHQLGLDIELIDLSRFPSPEAAGRELHLAGFDGLVLTSHEMPWTPEERARFPWDKFCLVKRDRAMPDIPCNLIRESAFDFVNLTLENITALRYRRLAVILTENASPRDDDARHGAVYNFRERKLPPRSGNLPARFTYSILGPNRSSHPALDRKNPPRCRCLFPPLAR